MKTSNYNKIILTIILILSALAYLNSFIQDDAFITFRYSKNLVNHGVLNWNIEEDFNVEGYSNFLWMLILTISFVLKIDPILFSKIIGIFLFIITLYTISKAGEFLFSDKKYIVFLLIILGTNYTFSIYATGGLETMMQTFFIISNFYFYLKISSNKSTICNLLIFSLLTSLAILTRLDSIIPLFFIFIFTVYQLYKHSNLKTIKLFLVVFFIINHY